MTNFIPVPAAPATPLLTLKDAQAFIAAHKARKGKKARVIAFTGHRESDFPAFEKTTLQTLTGPRTVSDPYDPMWFWNAEVQELLVDWLAGILNERKVTLVNTGMAKGLDMLGAKACIRAEIPFIAQIPFETQAEMWPEAIRQEYAELLSQAEMVVCVTPVKTLMTPNARSTRDLDKGKMVNAMHNRNKAMLLCADEVISLDQGKSYGGTRNCVDTAERMEMPVFNLWPSFEALVRKADYVTLSQTSTGTRVRYENHRGRAKKIYEPVENTVATEGFRKEMRRHQNTYTVRYTNPLVNAKLSIRVLSEHLRQLEAKYEAAPTLEKAMLALPF